MSEYNIERSENSVVIEVEGEQVVSEAKRLLEEFGIDDPNRLYLEAQSNRGAQKRRGMTETEFRPEFETETETVTETELEIKKEAPLVTEDGGDDTVGHTRTTEKNGENDKDTEVWEMVPVGEDTFRCPRDGCDFTGKSFEVASHINKEKKDAGIIPSGGKGQAKKREWNRKKDADREFKPLNDGDTAYAKILRKIAELAPNKTARKTSRVLMDNTPEGVKSSTVQASLTKLYTRQLVNRVEKSTGSDEYWLDDYGKINLEQLDMYPNGNGE